MVAVGKERATYQDVIDAPEHQVAEIVDGELHLSPRPAGRHAAAHMNLAGDLHAAFQRGRGGPGGWWFLIEPELHFGEDVVVPDLAGWRVERTPLPEHTQHEDPPFFTTAPDWICETLSPSTERFDRGQKLGVYLRAGIGHAWLVHPRNRSLEVLRTSAEGWVLRAMYTGDGAFRIEPFDAIELDLALVWSGGLPPTAPREPAAAYEFGH
jgi:Uma2 family endonuclease